MNHRVPDRGDGVWLEFQPQSREQAGRRPAVVLSPSAYNAKVGLGIFCPITSQVKGYPFEVVIPDGLAVRGAVLAGQVRNLDWRTRKAKHLCRLPDALTNDILAKLDILLRART